VTKIIKRLVQNGKYTLILNSNFKISM